MRDITQEEKNRIRDMVHNGTGGVLFQMPNFDNSIKVRSMITNSAAWGDLGHFLGHGITFGGIFHQINREGNWQELAAQVYERGLSKRLHCFKWDPKLKKLQNEEQVVIIGSTYFSVYMRGETSRKEIYFNKVMKLEYFPNLGLEVTVKSSNGEYRSMEIYNIFDNMIGLTEAILRYTIRAHYDLIYGDLAAEERAKVKERVAQRLEAKKVQPKPVEQTQRPAPVPAQPERKRGDLIGLLAKK